MHRWEGLQDCLEQPSRLHLLSLGCFQKTAGFALKEKKRKRRTEVRCLTELTQVHRHIRVTLISTSLRGMENIHLSTKLFICRFILFIEGLSQFRSIKKSLFNLLSSATLRYEVFHAQAGLKGFTELKS